MLMVISSLLSPIGCLILSDCNEGAPGSCGKRAKETSENCIEDSKLTMMQ